MYNAGPGYWAERTLSVKIVLIDFHTHTTASDGVLSPAEMLSRAAEAGIELLAITDHDTVAGFRAASSISSDYPQVQLVPGVEYSCRWSGTTIHIVGLGMDCDHPAMVEGLAVLDAARTERGGKIAQRLESRGFEVLPSAANFVFARHPGHSGESLFLGLRERQVIVRYFNKPRIDQFLRITVGTDEECETLLTALDEIL